MGNNNYGISLPVCAFDFKPSARIWLMDVAGRAVRITHQGYFLRVPERGVHALSSYITDDNDLFLLAHMGLAEVDPVAWRLQVTGLVLKPMAFRLAEVRAMPQHQVTSVHECAGSPLTPAVPKRRVGNVVWSGVRLRDVLEPCGVAPDAAFIWTQGLESGDFADVKSEPYVKDLPLSKALSPEVLLATGMNGIPLSSERGGPVRLVVPGWYGTNSVKWLGALTVTAHRAPGPYTTRFYNDPSANGPKPVWGIAPESIIVSPSSQDALVAGTPFLVQGWAWAESGVTRVEVTADGGMTWTPAMLERRVDFGWQRFSLRRRFLSGQTQLSCRCFDGSGNAQPESGARNAVHTVSLDVAAAR
jgi:DMSO/TMAO reductase YedYZ molybdopterin-dependent catalytic subunit